MDKIKIVVIEDDKEILDDLVELLTEENYIVVTAKNGKDGIELIKQELPALILCDILMPGVDGYEVLTEIQKYKDTRSIPFIFLSAKVEKQDVRRGMQLGADDYIFKPFTADEVLSAIETRLKKREMLVADLESNSDESKPHKKLDITEKIFMKIGGNPRFFKVSEIIYISAERQYTSMTVQGGKSVLIRKSINAWENILPTEYFLRIHRSTIINTEYISKIEKWHNGAYLIYLREIKEPFNVSKRFSAQLRNKKL